MCRHAANQLLTSLVHRVQLSTLSPLGFDPDLSGPVGAVSNRTALALLETVPTKRQNGKYGFLTAPVWNVSLILRSTIMSIAELQGLKRLTA